MGRRKCCWVGATLTIVGSALAFGYAGNSMMIYMGTALSAIGCLFFNYTMPSYLGDIIDHVEWKTHVRCDGISGSFYSTVMMVAVGIVQGIFNLGLMINRLYPARGYRNKRGRRSALRGSDGRRNGMDKLFISGNTYHTGHSDLYCIPFLL